MVEFSATLSDALAPVTLISGVGLLLVSMSARYCHATSRIRQLLAERKEESEDFHEEIDQSIDLIYKRASLLKTGILTLMISAAFSSLQVLVIVIERLFSLDLSLMKSTMLLASVIFIVISSCIYVSEVQVSVKALGLTVHHHNSPQSATEHDFLCGNPFRCVDPDHSDFRCRPAVACHDSPLQQIGRASCRERG